MVGYGAMTTGGSGAVQPNATTSYSATFGGNGGYGNCPLTVNVQCAPIYQCSGEQIQYQDAGCNTTNRTLCDGVTNDCVPGQQTCQPRPPVFNPGGGNGGTTGHLEAKPLVIRVASSTALYWNVSNVTSCTVSGNGDSWSGAAAGCANNVCVNTSATCTLINGGCKSRAINTTVTYTLTCTPFAGATFSPESVKIVPSPTFNEQ
jgi:hypothetical protein